MQPVITDFDRDLLVTLSEEYDEYGSCVDLMHEVSLLDRVDIPKRVLGRPMLPENVWRYLGTLMQTEEYALVREVFDCDPEGCRCLPDDTLPCDDQEAHSDLLLPCINCPYNWQEEEDVLEYPRHIHEAAEANHMLRIVRR